MVEKKIMTTSQIIEKYKTGERDFSNIKCTCGNFDGADLGNAIFKNSDMSSSTFVCASLQGCDFSECNLQWATLTKANLTNAKFVKAKITWADLNDAMVDKADFTEADLSWSFLFNVNLHAASSINEANFSMAVFRVEDITKEGLEKANIMLSNMKEKIPFEIWLRIRFSVSRTEEKFKRILFSSVFDSIYEAKVSYSNISRYKTSPAEEQNTVYSQNPVYTSASPYKNKKKGIYVG